MSTMTLRPPLWIVLITSAVIVSPILIKRTILIELAPFRQIAHNETVQFYAFWNMDINTLSYSGPNCPAKPLVGVVILGA